MCYAAVQIIDRIEKPLVNDKCNNFDYTIFIIKKKKIAYLSVHFYENHIELHVYTFRIIDYFL